MVSPPIPTKKQKMKTKDVEHDKLLSLACDFLQKSEQTNQASAAIAKVWSDKLDALEEKQRIYAEKTINDILFEARLGNLHKHSVKINEFAQNVCNTPISQPVHFNIYEDLSKSQPLPQLSTSSSHITSSYLTSPAHSSTSSRISTLMASPSPLPEEQENSLLKCFTTFSPDLQ